MHKITDDTNEHKSYASAHIIKISTLESVQKFPDISFPSQIIKHQRDKLDKNTKRSDLKKCPPKFPEIS